MVSKDGAKSCGYVETEEENGKCSFVLTLDNEGHLEISPHKVSEGAQPQPQPQLQERICSGICSKDMKSNVIKGGEPINSIKRRISISVMKEDVATESDDEEETVLAGACEGGCENDIVSIQAMQNAGALPHFVKIYNKDLRSKPSFVVLEDALVRKRIEENLQPCHCHAQQQTSPCDIGAHTGSQTDEYLLQYALSPQLVKRTSTLGPTCKPKVFSPATQRRPLATPQRQQIPQHQQSHTSSRQSVASVGSTYSDGSQVTSSMAPHVTISFIPTGKKNMMGLTPSQSPCSSCSSCACGNHCCLMKPASPLAAAATTTTAATCECNHCCLLKPQSQAPTPTPLIMGRQHQAVGFYPHSLPMNGNCSHLTLTNAASQHQQQQQQQHLYSLNNWYPQSHHCLCYPISTVNMIPNCPNPHCPTCCMHAHHSLHTNCGKCFNPQQQQQQQHQQQYQHNNYPAFGRQKRIKITDNSPVSTARRERMKRLLAQETQLPTKQKQKQHGSGQPLHPSASSITVKRMTTPSKNSSISSSADPKDGTVVTSVSTDLPVEKQSQARSIAGATVCEEQLRCNPSSTNTSLYMARFGRTCLILEPTAPTVLPRLLTKRISRYTSVMAWPSGSKLMQQSDDKPDAEEITMIK